VTKNPSPDLAAGISDQALRGGGMKAIFISGGGSGIGRAVAQRFAREGWLVGIGDISEAGMAETLALLGKGFATRLDVRDRAQWDAALAAFAAESGGIDVVFNNAGIPIGGPLVECAPDEIERVLDVNLKGVLFGAQAAWPWLKARAPGSCLLNTASAAGFYGMPGVSVYGATKFGVRALTEALDGEWAADGIRVRDLMPGFIDTPLLDAAPNRGSNAAIRDHVIPAGLEITPVEVVADAAWKAVHGDRLHTLVGRTARQAQFAARFLPGLMRRRTRAAALRPMG
jgi:NAD(P)-dependent dehydrogenase (short-subunit alcohol dehydrogenase family)